MSEASTIPSWAFVGAKIVCIDDAWTAASPKDSDLPEPVKGQVYIIDGIDVYGFVACYLVGFPNDAVYELSSFRPFVSPEQDSTMFRKLLQPKRVRIGETA